MRLGFLGVLLLLGLSGAVRAREPISALVKPEPAAKKIDGKKGIAKSAKSLAPKVPSDLSPCDKPLLPPQDLPRSLGETVRYVVDVNGLSVGTIDFKIERKGQFAGKPVTEYRSLFKIDALVAMLLPVEGRASAFVPDTARAPVVAMNKYKLDQFDIEEKQTFGDGALKVASKRMKNGESKDDARDFPGPVQDFVSGFYYLRTLPAAASGCAIIYGNQRAYTVWLEADGDEKIMTPVGLKTANRYAIRYAHDKSKKSATGRVWLGTGADRLPYKAEIIGADRLEARVHAYETGQVAAR